MLRNIDLKEISDGRLYDANDMVKAGSDDCSGCWDCCQGMGDSIFFGSAGYLSFNHRIRMYI